VVQAHLLVEMGETELERFQVGRAMVAMVATPLPMDSKTPQSSSLCLTPALGPQLRREGMAAMLLTQVASIRPVVGGVVAMESRQVFPHVRRAHLIPVWERELLQVAFRAMTFHIPWMAAIIQTTTMEKLNPVVFTAV
jgi:hypothetical protein